MTDSHCHVDYGYKKQGFSREDLVYRGPFQPYLSWWGLFWSTLFIIISGIQTWFKWNTSTFFTYCKYKSPSFQLSRWAHRPSDVSLFLFIVVFIGYKVIKKSKFRKWDERDFVTGIPTLEETEIPPVPPRNIWEKIASVLF